MTQRAHNQNLQMIRYLSAILLLTFLTSCSSYQKALKSEDVDIKYVEAEKMYDKEKYSKAIRLFEQIAPTFRGKTESEKMYYMFAMSYYKTKQYYLAGYQFESFVAGYPRSEKVEEASFLAAKCSSMLSPRYTLDQSETSKAIEKLQAFIDRYPDSPFLPEANQTVKTLREKIEKKVFENAKQYNTISDFKSALVALDNFIADYPGTPYREEAMYYKLDSAYRLAINSVPAKMEERLQNAKVIYQQFTKAYPSSSYKAQADDMLQRIETDLKQYIK